MWNDVYAMAMWCGWHANADCWWWLIIIVIIIVPSSACGCAFEWCTLLLPAVCFDSEWRRQYQREMFISLAATIWHILRNWFPVYTSTWRKLICALRVKIMRITMRMMVIICHGNDFDLCLHCYRKLNPSRHQPHLTYPKIIAHSQQYKIIM